MLKGRAVLIPLLSAVLLAVGLLSCKKNQSPDVPDVPDGASACAVDIGYQYGTAATDPDGDSVAIRFDWGDGNPSDWSPFVPSDVTIAADHVWPAVGTYEVKAQAQDAHGATSDWSRGHVVNVTLLGPQPPADPSMPSGPDTCVFGLDYTFSAAANDPDSDKVAIRFDWGDGDTSSWSGLVRSGRPVSKEHSWSDTGTYFIRAQARDGSSRTSGWSPALAVEVTRPGQQPPDVPTTPSGPDSGVVDSVYQFASSAADPDSDRVGIRFAWGDGDTSAWSQWHAGGTLVSDTHRYHAVGNYQIRAQARDVSGRVSAWSSSLTFTVDVQPNGTLLWRYWAGGNVTSSPAIGSDGTIYIGSWDNYLYAIGPDGRYRWHYLTYDRICSSPAVGPEGTIYVGSYDNYLYAINPTGSLKWCYETGDDIYSSPAVGSDGTVYTGSHDRYLYAINPDGSLKWRYLTDAYIVCSPAVGSDGTIYVAAWDNILLAINPDGSLKWRYVAGAYVSSSPAIGSDGTVYVGSWDSHLYAVNPDGSLKWRYQTFDMIYSSPAIGPDGTIYVGSYDNYLYAISPAGSLVWCYQTGDDIYSSPAVGSDGTVYTGSHDNCLYAINADGSLRWRYETSDKIHSSPSIGADGNVYVGASDNYVYAIKSAGTLTVSDWPKFRHDLSNTGRVGGR